MIRAIICILILFSMSCKERSQVAPLNQSQVKAEVKQMFDDYHLAIEREGLTGEFPFLDDSDDFFWVPPGYQSLLNYDSVRTTLETNAGLFSTVQFHWEELSIFPLSNMIANYSGIVGGMMTDHSGVETEVRIIESGTLIKRADGWKLLNGQSANLELKSDESNNMNTGH